MLTRWDGSYRHCQLLLSCTQGLSQQTSNQMAQQTLKTTVKTLGSTYLILLEMYSGVTVPKIVDIG